MKTPVSLIRSSAMELKISERAVLELVSEGNTHGPDLLPLVMARLNCSRRTAYTAIEDTQAVGWIDSKIVPGRGGPRDYWVTEEGQLCVADSSLLAKARGTAKARRARRQAKLNKFSIWDERYAGFCLNCSHPNHDDYRDKRIRVPQYAWEEFCSRCGSKITWHPELRHQVARTLTRLHEQEAVREREEAEKDWVPSRDPHAPDGAHDVSCNCKACEGGRKRFEEWRIEDRAYRAAQELESEARSVEKRRKREEEQQLIKECERAFEAEAARDTIEMLREIEVEFFDEPKTARSTRIRHQRVRGLD